MRMNRRDLLKGLVAPAAVAAHAQTFLPGIPNVALPVTTASIISELLPPI